MSNITKFDYEGQSISFEFSDGNKKNGAKLLLCCPEKSRYLLVSHMMNVLAKSELTIRKF